MRQKEETALRARIRELVGLVYPRMTLSGLENLPDEPSIIVGNHCQIHGPIISETRLPFDHYTWCIGQMMRKEEVAQYAFQDFWSGKPKQIRWLFRLISHLIPAPAAYLLSKGRTIPVYHDSRCIATFRKTMEKLQEGFHMVIFPECREPYNGIVYGFQDRFIDTAKMYYKKYGKCLAFTPMYLAPKLRRITFGKPIVYDPTIPIDEQRRLIAVYLMDTITEIALSLPPHTVIPYANIAKKDYPKNTLSEVKRHEAAPL